MSGPISRIANAVTSKQVTPSQVVNKALENIEASNPSLNFMAQQCPESALMDAALGLLAGGAGTAAPAVPSAGAAVAGGSSGGWRRR